jgi:hypothetical protein
MVWQFDALGQSCGGHRRFRWLAVGQLCSDQLGPTAQPVADIYCRHDLVTSVNSTKHVNPDLNHARCCPPRNHGAQANAGLTFIQDIGWVRADMENLRDASHCSARVMHRPQALSGLMRFNNGDWPS